MSKSIAGIVGKRLTYRRTNEANNYQAESALLALEENAMAEVTRLKEAAISRDGRSVTVKLLGKENEITSLDFSTINLERTIHELVVLLTNARQLSEVSKQGIVAFVRTTNATASLSDGRTVIVSFQLPSGLEMHYGMQPTQVRLLHCHRDRRARRRQQAPADT